MSGDFSSMRSRWLSERPKYDEFAQYIKHILSESIRKKGIWARTSARAKDVDSFLKKVLRKGYSDPFTEMNDKAGIRVIVRFLGELKEVEDLVKEKFEILKREDKTEANNFKEFGYSGIHLDARLLNSALDDGTRKYAGMACELQIRTLPQDVWAEMDHGFSYKSDLVIPDKIKRRIYRLSALFEISDNEYGAINKDINSLPEAPQYSILTALEKHFFRLVGWEYDKELSLELISKLKSLYGEENHLRFESVIEPFITSFSKKIEGIYKRYSREEDHPILLFQPEALMIFERLESDYFALKEKWQEFYLLEELQRMAIVWGKSLE